MRLLNYKPMSWLLNSYLVAFGFYVVYIMSIESYIAFFSGLFNDYLLEILTSGLLASSLLPIAPEDTIKPKRLTQLENQQFEVPEESKEILVGLLLGDLNCEKQALNPRFRFIQGIVHEKYLLHLFSRFKDYCPAEPKIVNPKPDKRTGIKYNYMYFNTYALPCFLELYNLFYEGGKTSGSFKYS